MASGFRAAAPRWAVVGVVVAVLAALPALVGALPVADPSVPAAELRAAVLASADVQYSGYAESAGGLALPVTDQLDSVADLFSDRTEMRVWWRGPDDHRVDVITTAGETGIHRDARGTWTWEYERATATRAATTPLALPAPPDLLPATLGRRLLSEAADAELTRIGARRIAGRDALGLRTTPAEPASAVRRVDVWVDRASGLPLQVVILDETSEVPALDTRFLDLELGVPDAATTSFVPPPDARLRTADQAEIVLEAGRRLAPVRLPATLAGLPRRMIEGAPPGIGLYGRGVTLLAVAPVPRRLADGLRRTLGQSPDAVTDEAGTRIAAGPVGLMLLDPPDAGPYVLTGTVTLDALVEAAAQLPALGGSP
ncbi:transcriptional regulator [Blastococcus sp. BMG 814]|uniref:Transcriptional regulator n=1 Tax=Blastococcus carthaginiensis TaxID=3050034 RepID=A0ABT9IG25_9ACTN|nr:transcriptional regulator [Blastococcus carthaginiensis]MDP5184516.1 transcriptional regulator [Blastococcus carthaginiensis]